MVKTILLIFFVTIGLFLQTVSAQTACNTTITANTNLQNDILNCSSNGINIGASGITLDCNNHRITAQIPSLNKGIYSSNVNNIIIKDCIIEDFAWGIFLDNTQNAIIEKNKILRSGNSGQPNPVAGGQFGCNPPGHQGAGIGISIVPDTSTNTIIRKNSIEDSCRLGISTLSNNTLIKENKLSNNGWYFNSPSIYVQDSSFNKIIKNKIVQPWGRWIFIYGSSIGNIILGNQLL